MQEQKELLDEIAELDKQFEEGSEKPEEQVEDVKPETTEQKSEGDEAEYSDEIQKGIEEGTIEEVKIEKPTKEEKSNYAFAKLRTENTRNKELLEKLVEIYGLDSIEDLREKADSAHIKKQAEKQGVSEEIYRKLSANEKRIKELEEERDTHNKNAKVAEVKNALDETVKELNLTDKDSQEILASLDKEGYTIDDLISTKNVKRLFKSVASELSLGQGLVGLDTRKVAKKHEVTSEGTLDDLIDEEMKEYAKKRGLNF